MHSVLLSPREHHNVRSLTDYRKRHAQAIGKKAAKGQRVKVHEDPTPIRARVDHGAWLGDCPCGAGVSVEPEWPIALCFGCGAILKVIAPKKRMRAALERLLVARPRMKTRNWNGRESVKAITAENRAHGVAS